MTQLILGSSSPRRNEILQYFSLNFKQISPHFDEESIVFNGDPALYVQAIAEGKLFSLSAQYPESLILTADTIVYKSGKVYGKPKDEQEAFQFLHELQGSWHSVFTGVAFWSKGKLFKGFDETQVLFNPLSAEQIALYLKALDWRDKAGSYAMQLSGSVIVNRIKGCYYNVVGLPINVVQNLLKQADIDLWNHLKKF